MIIRTSVYFLAGAIIFATLAIATELFTGTDTQFSVGTYSITAGSKDILGVSTLGWICCSLWMFMVATLVEILDH